MNSATWLDLNDSIWGDFSPYADYWWDVEPWDVGVLEGWRLEESKADTLVDDVLDYFNTICELPH